MSIEANTPPNYGPGVNLPITADHQSVDDDLCPNSDFLCVVDGTRLRISPEITTSDFVMSADDLCGELNAGLLKFMQEKNIPLEAADGLDCLVGGTETLSNGKIGIKLSGKFNKLSFPLKEEELFSWEDGNWTGPVVQTNPAFINKRQYQRPLQTIIDTFDRLEVKDYTKVDPESVKVAIDNYTVDQSTQAEKKPVEEKPSTDILDLEFKMNDSGIIIVVDPNNPIETPKEEVVPPAEVLKEGIEKNLQGLSTLEKIGLCLGPMITAACAAAYRISKFLDRRDEAIGTQFSTGSTNKPTPPKPEPSTHEPGGHLKPASIPTSDGLGPRECTKEEAERILAERIKTGNFDGTNSPKPSRVETGKVVDDAIQHSRKEMGSLLEEHNGGRLVFEEKDLSRHIPTEKEVSLRQAQNDNDEKIKGENYNKTQHDNWQRDWDKRKRESDEAGV